MSSCLSLRRGTAPAATPILAYKIFRPQPLYHQAPSKIRKIRIFGHKNVPTIYGNESRHKNRHIAICLQN